MSSVFVSGRYEDNLTDSSEDSLLKGKLPESSEEEDATTEEPTEDDVDEEEEDEEEDEELEQLRLNCGEKEENPEGYKLLQKIGNGSFSTVYCATSTLTGEMVAVKIIDKKLLCSENKLTKEKLLKEIQALYGLNHPNIVQVREVKDTERKLYIITEYCNSGDVLKLIRAQKGGLPENIARTILLQVVDAIHYAHDNGFVHRDIKLENLFVHRQGGTTPVVKVGDWGFASRWSCDCYQMDYCGSLPYLSPEICEKREYKGPESDVWSLGVCLYGMVAGYLPFGDKTDLFEKIKHSEFYMPLEFSPELRDLINRMLDVSVSRRITIGEIKRHPWCKITSTVKIQTTPAVETSLPVPSLSPVSSTSSSRSASQTLSEASLHSASSQASTSAMPQSSTTSAPTTPEIDEDSISKTNPRMLDLPTLVATSHLLFRTATSMVVSSVSQLHTFTASKLAVLKKGTKTAKQRINSCFIMVSESMEFDEEAAAHSISMSSPPSPLPS
eukprot:TRINITY_DN12957_c0_g1_i1.p1 TRINITY_DN12957_c0_g1~~TRINITY_DN12957_c0_g1_i1.p1  ORF type:complete len:499 (+),score=109.33 TRINITY_DN12957_c0_g1_i1:275-1771(+)